VLKVKELQLFDCKIILNILNICTQVPKKYILEEFKVMLKRVAVAKVHDITAFEWNEWGLPHSA
jgi:hypothetical protein